MGLGRFMLVVLLVSAPWLEDSHFLTFWLLPWPNSFKRELYRSSIGWCLKDYSAVRSFDRGSRDTVTL